MTVVTSTDPQNAVAVLNLTHMADDIVTLKRNYAEMQAEMHQVDGLRLRVSALEQELQKWQAMVRVPVPPLPKSPPPGLDPIPPQSPPPPAKSPPPTKAPPPVAPPPVAPIPAEGRCPKCHKMQSDWPETQRHGQYNGYWPTQHSDTNVQSWCKSTCTRIPDSDSDKLETALLNYAWGKTNGEAGWMVCLQSSKTAKHKWCAIGCYHCGGVNSIFVEQLAMQDQFKTWTTTIFGKAIDFQKSIDGA